MSTPVPRYLVPFHPKHVPHFFTDVLVVGSGLAGLRAALAVDPKLSVVVVTKQGVEQSNSNQAQGGIAGVLDPDDRFEDHVADTLEAGGSLCDPAVVERVIREAPQRIGELIDWGTQFDQAGDRLALGREGGHGRDRIAHALGDATGKEIMRVMVGRAKQSPNIDVWENTFTLDLLTLDGVCRGALVWNGRHGKTMVWAKQTILATGGAGQLYRETTNPEVATGDGMALAYRAGAELRDMEFMQFHPDGALHRRRQPQPDQRGRPRRRGVAGRSPRPPLHDRLRSARRAGPARRGEPGHRQPDGEDAASERLSRPEAPRSGSGCWPASPASPRCAPSSIWTSPAIGFRSGRGRTT